MTSFRPKPGKLCAVSSFRPLDECPEVAKNQLRAKKSWDAVFDDIFLLGDFDERLATPSTHFIKAEQFPHISLMIWIASKQLSPTCILNADIVVAPNLKELLDQGWQKQAMAMTSKRLEFDPATEDYFKARVVDLGADFFCATQDVWKRAYVEVPQQFRIGHNRWDNWMLNFLWFICRRRFIDISTLGPIFHPKHGSRFQPHSIDDSDVNFYSQIGFPPPLTS
jgi:hypothetical protein